MSIKDELRFELRRQLETVMKDYYESCLETGYNFEGDLEDVIYDATDGKISASVA